MHHLWLGIRGWLRLWDILK